MCSPLARLCGAGRDSSPQCCAGQSRSQRGAAAQPAPAASPDMEAAAAGLGLAPWLTMLPSVGPTQECEVLPPAAVLSPQPPSDWWLATSDLLPHHRDCVPDKLSWVRCRVCVASVPSCVSVLCPSSLSISSSAAVKEVASAFASDVAIIFYYEVLCRIFDVETNKEIPILSSECRLAFVMQCFLESGFSCWVWKVLLHFRTLAAAELKTSYLVHTYSLV